MDLAEIRKLVIIAMFSDDVLFKRLVLKGGNAISLVYGYGARGSLDVDFSIDGDFDDLEEATKRINAALTDRFRVIIYLPHIRVRQVYNHPISRRWIRAL